MQKKKVKCKKKPEKLYGWVKRVGKIVKSLATHNSPVPYGVVLPSLTLKKERGSEQWTTIYVNLLLDRHILFHQPFHIFFSGLTGIYSPYKSTSNEKVVVRDSDRKIKRWPVEYYNRIFCLLLGGIFMWKATSFEAFVQKILQVRLHSDIDPMTDDCKVVFSFFCFIFLLFFVWLLLFTLALFAPHLVPSFTIPSPIKSLW